MISVFALANFWISFFTEKNMLIPYFQEAEWMKNKHLNKIMKQNTDRSAFEVLQAGLYLLYVQVIKYFEYTFVIKIWKASIVLLHPNS